MKHTNLIRKTLTAAAATAGLLTASAIPAFAGPQLLSNGGFEAPIVSGAVAFSTGSAVGTCANGAPYLGPDFNCWSVRGMVTLIHNDYAINGVKVKPAAGAQFLELAGDTTSSATGGSIHVAGGVVQTVKATPNTTPTLIVKYATMPFVGAASTIKLTVTTCTSAGLACVQVASASLPSVSTGNPAIMGWKTYRVLVPVNVDMGLVRVQVEKSAQQTSVGDPVVDAFSLS